MTTPTNSEVGWSLKESWETAAPEDQFWVAVDIFVNRSHIINRRLIGSEVLGEIPVKSDKGFDKIKQLLFSFKSDSEIQELIKRERNDFLNQSEQPSHNVAFVKKVLPKNRLLQPCLEIVLKDQSKKQVSFFNRKQDNSAVPSFPYAFSYVEGKLSLLTDSGVDDSDSSFKWLSKQVIPKLIKWMEKVKTKADDNPSLRLVSVTDYSALYSKLKDTYGKALVKIWPENTDPLKFVYEDIGIAAYLLLLWAGKPKQRFVDLGCGNGLLVHILNSEGHLGVGYDIRARKIWSLYPPSTKLEIRTIIPSESEFPDADWLLGNHSDELTVWIPVMAARSSYSCNVFLLPCCPFEFDGRKYNRTKTCVSQYEDFLNYVESVCDKCGFVAEKDKLRIPSTKRTCFVTKARAHSESAWKEQLDSIQVLVDSRCTVRTEAGEVTSFKPRAEERVRNCTKINSDILQTIVNLVTKQLLAKKRLSIEGWNYGAVVEISSLAKIIPQETLKMLKNECGGLQTLLKNHHHIFQVQSGKVEFRIPKQKTKSDSTVWKTKPCWFYHNHPNKCPLPDAYCSFLHDAEEITSNNNN